MSFNRGNTNNNTLNEEQREVIEAIRHDVKASLGKKRVFMSLDTKRKLCHVIKERYNDTTLFRQVVDSVHSSLFTLDEGRYLTWTGLVRRWVQDYEAKLYDMKYAIAIRRPADSLIECKTAPSSQTGDSLVKVLRELKNLKATKVDNNKKIARLMAECQQIEQQNKDIDGLIGKLSATIIDTL